MSQVSIVDNSSSQQEEETWLRSTIDRLESEEGHWLCFLYDDILPSDKLTSERVIPKRFWERLTNHPKLRRLVMGFLIRTGVQYIPWPVEFSCGDLNLPTWSSYKDPALFGRVLPPIDRMLSDVPAGDLANWLFRRTIEKPESNHNSNLLFPWFAQWFVEQFFKTGRNWYPELGRKDDECGLNWSGHDIDLSTVYGDTPERECVLRSHHGGQLRSQIIKGEEYPPYWKELTEEEQRMCPMASDEDYKVPTKQKFRYSLNDTFALGHPRQNLHPGQMLWATLFLREHNRLCDVFAAHYPSWDDDELFSAARKTLIIMLLKMTVEDYIQHINTQRKIFKFVFDPTIAMKLPGWQYSNRIGFEFDLLYRWHSLIPDSVISPTGERIPLKETFFDAEYLVKHGVDEVIRAAARQPANQFGARNTPQDLLFLDEISLRHSRIQRLASYNDYCERFGVKRKKKFKDLTDDRDVLAALKRAYKSVDDVEFYVGLMVEKVKRGIFPELLTIMVLAHAMKGIFGNPLVSPRNWKKETIDPEGVGWREIEKTNLANLVARNTNLHPDEVSFTVPQ